MTEIVKLDPIEFGLTESKASEIAAQFKPMLDKMVELETEYNSIVEAKDYTKELSAKAKDLRLKYVKVRTGTAEIHKKQKDFYLSGGRFVDGWKNAQIFASKGIEEALENIEKHFERQEEEKLKLLGYNRALLLKAFINDTIDEKTLSGMSEEIWCNYFSGCKMSHERKLEAERQAEVERLAKIEADKAEREAQLVETQRLIAENKKIAEEQRVEREKQAQELAAQAEKAKKERLLIEAQRKAEQDKADALLEAQRKEAEKAKKIAQEKLKAEKDKSDKLAAELKAKALEEANRLAKEKAEQKRLQAAPDKDKLLTWIHDIKGIESLKLNSESAIEVSEKLKKSFQCFYEDAINQINTL